MTALLSSATARNALVIIAVILTGAALFWLGAIITPLLLAVFMAVMVDGFGRVINRRAAFLPPGAAVAVAIIIAGVVFTAAALIVADNATMFIGRLTDYGPKLDALMANLATRFGSRAPHSVSQIIDQLDPTPYLGSVAQALQGFASSAVLVLIYLGFLLASRHAFERKAVKLFRGRDERQEALRVFLHIRDSVERYLWIQTVTGATIAVLGGLLMMMLGLENAFFWAFLIFILNFIPIVGAAVAIVLPTLFALVQFDNYGSALLLLGGLFTIMFLIGNIVLPRLQGDSLNMDPLVVLMSLGFWGTIWGLPGMFLSTPLTVLSMVILAEFDGSHWIAVLLSADGNPLGSERGSHRFGPEPAPKRGILRLFAVLKRGD
jgi:predicted PurR-regulated permease PerM